MSETAHRYYRPSSAAPISGVFTMLTVGGLAAVVSGTIYALVAYYDPFVVFTVFGTVIAGISGAAAVGYGARVGKVRNRNVVFIVCVIVGLLMVYFSWVAYIGVLSGSIVFAPQTIWRVIQIIAQQGVWELDDHRPVGAELYVIWLCEAAIICGPVIWSKHRKRPPFCEACERWTEAIGLDIQLASECRDEIVQALEAERYSALTELQREPVHENDHIHLTAYKCPGCEESYFLSAWRSITSLNKQGAWETRTLDLFKYMIVPHEVVEGLASLNAEAPEEDVDHPSEDDYAPAEPGAEEAGDD